VPDEAQVKIEVEQYLKECVKIEPTVIEEEFIRLPADLAHWNEREAVALRAHLTSKIEVDRAYATAQIIERERLAMEGGKPTEARVAAAVELNKDYNEARVRAVEAEVERARLRGVVMAISAKREMLVSLGAHVRKEMESDPVLREQVRANRLQREE
jgi:hypothetical protein